MDKAQYRCLLVTWLVPLWVMADSSPDESAFDLPEILITPSWHEVDLQREDSTVNTLSGEQLEGAGVDNTQDLQFSIPGMVFTSSAGVGQTYLRGVGGTASAASDPAVATFTDGVYLTRVSQGWQDFYDVERVEVIKGPRGVHLGRNVVGGALSIITRDPELYEEAYLDVAYGNYATQQWHAAWNQPVADSDLSWRLAGTVQQRDGYAHNIFRHEDLDDQDFHAWRAKLRYQPDNNLDVIFSIEQNHQDDARGLAKQPNPDIGINAGILLGGTVPSDPREVTHNTEQYQDIKNQRYTARLTWRKGDKEFRSTTAYQQNQQEIAYDLDATEIDYVANYPKADSDTVSQEFRLSSRQDLPLSWTAGAYFLAQDAFQQQDLRFPLLAMQKIAASDTENSAYAVFAELAWLFSPGWQARVGARYSHDEARLDLRETEIIAATPSSSDYQAKDSWQALTPEFGISFTPDQNRLYYASVSRGYKAGGHNAFAQQPPFAPEFLWAYEAGIKLTVPDQRLRINTALFHYDYTDMQLVSLSPDAPLGSLPVVANAAKASIQGLDIQLWKWFPNGLELSAGVSLLNAHFDEFSSVDPNNTSDDPNRAGGRLAQAPDVSLLLGAQYRWPKPGKGEYTAQASYRYQSAVYFNPYEDEAVKQAAYGLLSASLGYRSYQHNWYLELYGNNLTNELYAQNIIRADPVLGTARFWGEPRVIGLRLGYTR